MAVLCALAALVLPAVAGDRALIEVHGFDAERTMFGFTEYGIQDGSGFPYANFHLVALESGEAVSGTPIRVRLETETADLAAARAALAEEAADFLAGLDAPPETLALNGDGVPGAADRLSFGAVGYLPGTTLSAYELVLDVFVADGVPPCESYFDRSPAGFALTLVGGEETREILRSQAGPDPQWCPFTYRLYGVFSPHYAGGIEAAVAVVSVYPGGFEGPDRRFIAVPLAMASP